MATAAMPIRKPYNGLPILKQGFRPFFLAACLWAIVVVLGWISVFISPVRPNFGLPMLVWHQHELLFGYAGAVIAGFLLTASANWASRPALSGGPLLVLFSLWMAARLALLLPLGAVPVPFLAVLALAFPVLLITLVTRELVLGDARKNLIVVGIVGLYALADGVFFLELYLGKIPVIGIRSGIGALLLLLMLIGGRVVPAFTRNWMKKRGATNLPAEFSRFDSVTVAVSAITLLAWIALPSSVALAVMMIVAGLLNAVRLGRWQSHRTLTEPLVWVMHIAYAFIPAGFLLNGLSILQPSLAPGAIAIHVWTIGAVNLMCLAVMTRASLGHMGQPLKADRLIVSIYALSLLCIVARVAASYGLVYQYMLTASALAWCAAHAVFVVRYGRGFVTQR